MQRSIYKIRYMHKKPVKMVVNAQILDYFRSKQNTSENNVVEKFGLVHRLSIEKNINETLYRNALAEIKKEDLSIYDKIKAMHYASVLDSDKFVHNFLRFITKKINIEELKSLTDFELFIMCNSLFRCSIPMETNLLEFLANKAKVFSYKNDPWILVSFIKCLRHARHYDDDLFSIISNELKQQIIDEVSLSALVHITMYFADAHYSDLQFIKFLVQNCVKKIDLLKNIRSKDLNNLLWCCSQYCDKDINQIIIDSSIRDKLSGIFVNDNITMISSLLLWSWMAQVDVTDLVKRYINVETITKINKANNFKDISRLNLLLSCVSIEAPGLLCSTALNMRTNKLDISYKKHVSTRPALEKSINFLEKNKTELRIKNILFNYQVPCLNLAGIKIESQDKVVNVEIIDDSVCLRNSSIVNGLMKLKLRLMRKMNLKVRCKGKSIDSELLKNETLMLLK